MLSQILVEWTGFFRGNLLYIVIILVIRILRHSLIRHHLLIEVKFNASNIGSTDSTLKVEALLPSSKYVYAFIVCEHIFVFVHMRWLNWGQVSYNMSTVVSRVNSWRVEPVVISG